MRLALISLGYDIRDKFPVELKEPFLAAIVTDPALKIFSEPIFKEIEGKEDVLEFDSWHSQFLVDMDKMPQLRFEVIAVSNLVVRTIADIKESAGPAPINEKVNVIVPGNFLSEVADVKVVYDCCTDALRKEILEGWRILAICPQPDQRRPDYVLGKKE